MNVREIATLVKGKNVEEVHDWVDKFNHITKNNIDATEVVLAMNKNGAKIPTVFDTEEGPVKGQANYGMTDGKLTIGMNFRANAVLPAGAKLNQVMDACGKALRETMESFTVKPKKRKTKINHFSKEENEILLENINAPADKQLSYAELAKLLGRPKNSIYSRVSTLKKTLSNSKKYDRRRSFTDAEDKILIANYKAPKGKKLTSIKIGEKIGRTETAVNKRLFKLRKQGLISL